MSCNNCMNHRPDRPHDKKGFACPECNQKYRLAGVGPGNYWEEDGPITVDPRLSDISLDRLCSEMDRRDKIKALRDEIKELQDRDRQLSQLTGMQLAVEIEHKKKAKGA